MNDTQLTQEQRHQIAILKKAGHKQIDIADMTRMHKSTVSRGGGSQYRAACLAKQAHRLAMGRRQEKVYRWILHGSGG